VIRHGPVLVLVLRRSERRLDEVALPLVDDRARVLQPALRGELGGPDHVHAEHVALGGLGAQALHELSALLVGRLGKLDELDGDVGVGLLEEVDGGAVRPAGVLADTPGDVALGLGRIGGRGGLLGVTASVIVVAAATHHGERNHAAEQRPDPLPHPDLLLAETLPRSTRADWC
jgi:hypothetical protein